MFLVLMIITVHRGFKLATVLKVTITDTQLGSIRITGVTACNSALTTMVFIKIRDMGNLGWVDCMI